MKMIKPVVNFSKVAENYDTFVLGFHGVLTEGDGLLPEAVKTVMRLLEAGKNVVIISNSGKRIVSMVSEIQNGGINPALLSCVMTAGEILHYKLKCRSGDFAAIGDKYYHLGNSSYKGVFEGLDYTAVANIENAHFIYMDSVANVTDSLDKYLPDLEHAAALGLPFVCAGNDTSSFEAGKICLAAGALCEQYAVMGGRIITLGKPDIQMFNYCLSSVKDRERTLIVGDNLATDIKGAELLAIDSALISKGVHVNYLGEGYIPDVAKTRELSNNYDVSPQYVMSGLRW